MYYLKVSLGFSRESDTELERSATSIHDAMTGNESYPTPPITLAALKTAIDEFAVALANQWSAGPLGTSIKNDKRAALITILVKIGSYVQIEANGDQTVLISSGYKPISTSRTSVPLPTPVPIKVVSMGEGSINITVSSVPRARAYEVRHTPADGEPANWQSSVFTRARLMRVFHLIPGKRYLLQIRAIGGLTGQSEWSAPFSQMAT